MCQVNAAGGEEEAGGSHRPVGGGAGGGAGQHGDAQRPLQKEHPAGRLTTHEMNIKFVLSKTKR